MFKSLIYVLKENIQNLYRIVSIAKYEYLAGLRDSKFGVFWSFASPAIQVLTYWLVFGIGMSRGKQEGIEYLPWVIVGFSAWWYLSPCITGGCSAIFSKSNIISRMKFPVSILPATTCAKEMINHFFMLIIAVVVIIAYGFTPNIYWLGTVYYLICAFAFAWVFTMISSVITMLWRDMRTMVRSFMRLLLYMSPVLWTAKFKEMPFMNYLMKLNPIYYIVQGYRDSLLFSKPITAHPHMTLYFWGVCIIMMLIGSSLMFRFKKRFVDLL